MDAADIAAELEERERLHALAKHQSRQTEETSATWCVECDEVIPQRRRQAVPGVQTCVDCQELLERAI